MKYNWSNLFLTDFFLHSLRNNYTSRMNREQHFRRIPLLSLVAFDCHLNSKNVRINISRLIRYFHWFMNSIRLWSKALLSLSSRSQYLILNIAGHRHTMTVAYRKFLEDLPTFCLLLLSRASLCRVVTP